MPPPGCGFGVRPSPRLADDRYISTLDESHHLFPHLRNLDDVVYPDKFEIFDNSKVKPHIYNQFNIGSCACNAVAAAYLYECQRLGMEKYFSTDPGVFYPSRLFLYYMARLPGRGNLSYEDWRDELRKNPPHDLLIDDTGTEITTLLRILQYFGVADETSYRMQGGWGGMPYYETWDGMSPRLEEKDVFLMTRNPASKDANISTQSSASRPPLETCWSALYQILDLDWFHLDLQLKNWKLVLLNGMSVILSIHCYSSSFDYSWKNDNGPCDYVPKKPGANDKPDDEHAMLAVGWIEKYVINGNSYGECFKVQNSWGKNSHDGGFLYIPCDWLTTPAPGVQPTKEDPGTLIFEGVVLDKCSLSQNYKEYIG